MLEDILSERWAYRVEWSIRMSWLVTAGVQTIGFMKPSRNGVEHEVFDGRSE